MLLLRNKDQLQKNPFASSATRCNVSELQVHYYMTLLWRRTVNLAPVQCECLTGKQTVIARIKSIHRTSTADFVFCRKCWFLGPISRREKCPFCPTWTPMKAGAVFVVLTAAYDTVWHRGLTCKLLRLIHDRHMVRTVMEIVGNRSFTIATGNGKRRRLRRLKTASHRDLSEPLLFNIYISDLPTTVSTKYAYADDLAIIHADGDWQAVEGGAERWQGNCRRIPLDLEAKAQYYKNDVGSLPPQQ